MKKVLLVLLVIIAAACVFVASRPSAYHIERSTTIAAPASVVYANVDDFHKWDRWSPWEKLDPKMKKDFSGAESGTGASYHWAGNDKVGEGRMTITEAQPSEKVGIKLDFLKPMQMTSQASFTFAPAATGTNVTWAMDGKNGFVEKGFGVFMNMDKMVGKDFDQGLAALKSVSEAQASSMPADTASTAASTR